MSGGGGCVCRLYDSSCPLRSYFLKAPFLAKCNPPSSTLPLDTRFSGQSHSNKYSQTGVNKLVLLFVDSPCTGIWEGGGGEWGASKKWQFSSFRKQAVFWFHRDARVH